MKLWKLAVVTTVMLSSHNVNAALVFTDVSATTNSITFTIDGDMTGYDSNQAFDQFSIRYSMSIYNEDVWGTYTPNVWSSSVFDNATLEDHGNTGDFGAIAPYTWSEYTTTLAGAIANNRTVTMTSSTNWLISGATGQIDFLWGNGHVNHTLLDQVTVTVSAVPVPAAIWLFGSGMIGLIAFMRRR